MDGKFRYSRPHASMMWRIAAAMMLVVAFAVLLTGGVALRRMQHEREALGNDRLRGVNSSFRHDVEARLAAAGATVQLLSADDAGQDDVVLQTQVARAQPLKGVLVVPWKADLLDATSHSLPRLTAEDWLQADAGQTLLKTVFPPGGHAIVYLLHRVGDGGGRRLALFEVDPKWLWDGARELNPTVAAAIVDASGQRINMTPPLSSGVVEMVLGTPVYDAAPGQVQVVRDWQADGKAWRGVISRFDFGGSRVDAPSWLVFTYAQTGSQLPHLAMLAGVLWPLAVSLLVAVLLAASYLARRWEPVLEATVGALRRLQAGEFPRVEPDGTDLPHAVASAFNQAANVLERRHTALCSLGEIDRTLLESGDVEQALDGVLRHLRTVMGCDGAEVVLLDRDAEGYGRSFVALGNGSERPVSRVNVDADMLETLCESPQGLTITRCEVERHSFLEPLQDAAQYFWVWPVSVRERVAAVIAVGFARVPDIQPELAEYGGECALRLSRALVSSVRGEELYRQAHFDSLTGLPNRVLFRDRLSQEVAAAADGGRHGALLYVDLDHFKKVNDTEGHQAGDQLLTIVAQRLRASVKDGDTVARLGGDEFTVILHEVETPEAAQEVARRIIDSLRRPIHVAGRDHHVSGSIGITLYPGDGTRVDDLMRNADQAMYRAKDGGRARAAFFDRRMTGAAGSTVARSGLFRALRRREFSLYYQPQYTLGDCSLVGVEALLRWNSPQDGMRYPKEFVPAAEESGLIVDIGAWVLEAACGQMAQWRRQGVAPDRLALNVSMQQLRTPQFTLLVEQALKDAVLPPQLLELEITESVFAEEEARTTLRQLAALGVRLALDDFGTGYSSLNYLRQYPVHSIKIDRSFMQEVPDSIQAATLAETIINMAHALSKGVVAEGVETLEQLEFLRSRGCDLAQGFVLSPPVSTAAMTQMLESRLSRARGNDGADELPVRQAAG